MTSSAGIYVHLPYCASRCGYCAFVVTTDASSREQYIEALLQEVALVSEETGGETFDSIYLGGGTPSLLAPGEIARVLSDLGSHFTMEPDTEVTLEANPEDVIERVVPAWIDAGVNRVSVGVQSLDDAELAAVGRRHDAAAARTALDVLGRSGLSVSGDLILGLPGQTGPHFRSSLDGLLGAGVEHVSVYLLETDKSKAVEEDRRLRPERYLSDDEQAELWLEMGKILDERGFLHYEISNWARPARQARHNLKYWTRAPTLGLGVSAHEFWRGRRRANVSTLPAYFERLGRGERPTALDRAVGAEEAAAERIVLGLRLSPGVARDEIENWIRDQGDARLWSDYADWRSEGLLAERGDRLALTERGYLLSNEILCRFV